MNIKSWQGGFSFGTVIAEIEANKVVSRRRSDLRYRELVIPKWSRAFIKAVQERTGATEFTHVLAVTLAKGNPNVWTERKQFRTAMNENPLCVLTLKQMVEAIEPNLTQTPAATDIGRTLQLFRVAGLRPKAVRPAVIEQAADDLET